VEPPKVTDGRSQVSLTAALAVRVTTWFRDEEATVAADGCMFLP
jgi:hypothetical protein